MESIAVAFTGPSNSGKTTLIVKISEILTKTFQVAIIKNDPKNKAQFDVKGKDSYNFYQTGAEVVVTSPERTTLFSQREKNLKEIIRMLGDFDILLVEGLKTLPLPRIGVFREDIYEDYFPYIKAAACSKDVDRSLIPKNIDILELDDPLQIVEWLMKNGTKVKKGNSK